MGLFALGVQEDLLGLWLDPHLVQTDATYWIPKVVTTALCNQDQQVGKKAEEQGLSGGSCFPFRAWWKMKVLSPPPSWTAAMTQQGDWDRWGTPRGKKIPTLLPEPCTYAYKLIVDFHFILLGRYLGAELLAYKFMFNI